MKQLIFMVVMTLAGTLGVYVVSPFWGVVVYYIFAVLRPQYMWKWSLPQDISWSFYVALASIGAAVASSLGMKLGKEEGAEGKRWTFGHWAVILFGVWVLITYITAQNHDVAYLTLVEYIKIFIMFVVAASLIQTVGQVWSLMVTTALVLAYICYEINFLYFVNGYLGVHRNGYGGLDNNGIGLILATGVPLCWFVYEGTPRWWRWGFLALIPIIIHAVLMTYSRGAMVSLLAALPWLVMRSSNRVRLSLFLGVLLAVGVPLMAGEQIRKRFMTIENHEADESANARRSAWRAAWKMTLDYPIFGVGIRNANLFSHRYGADLEGRTIHSQYFQTMADNGFVGLGLYLMMFITAFYITGRVRRSVRGRSDQVARRIRATASGLECALFLYSVGSVFLSLEVVELPYLLILLVVQLGGLTEQVAAAPEGDTADEPIPLDASHHPSVAEQELLASGPQVWG